jgi:hypothetical protein
MHSGTLVSWASDQAYSFLLRLSLYRHPFLYTLFTSRFTLIINNKLYEYGKLGDHLCTSTAHSGVKKAHDWVVDQLVDHFRPTYKVKTQQVVKSRGQHCGDMELSGYLSNVTGRYRWSWTSSSTTIVSEVLLTLFLMENYIGLMI